MFSSKINSEIGVNFTYLKYGRCRCCTTSGLHRHLGREYFFNNIKEDYRDIFLKCYNLKLSLHHLISSLICENCVNRLRDAFSFRMMVVASEELLLNTVMFDPKDDIKFVDVPQDFTTQGKINPSSDVYQDELENSTENQQVNDEEAVNDNDGTNDDVPLNDKERTNDDVQVKGKERVNDEERMNDDDEWSDSFDDSMTDDDGQGESFDDPMDDEYAWSDVFDDTMPDDIRVNERKSNDVTLKNKERVNDDDDGWSDVFVDPMNDDDDWSTDSDTDELVIDEDTGNISSGTDDNILTDEDPDECGSTFDSTITRSETSLVDDEPSAMVRGEKKLLSKFTPVRPLPKRRQLVKICPKFHKHLTKLQSKIVKPKSIERFFKTKTPKEKDKRERETKTKWSDIKPLRYSILNKLIKAKSTGRVSKTKTHKTASKQTFETCISEKLVEPKTILQHKHGLAAYIPDKLIGSKSIEQVSKTTYTHKTKEPKTELSEKRALEPAPEKLVEPNPSLSDNRAQTASIVGKLVKPKTKLLLSYEKALLASTPEKAVDPKTILSDTQSIPEKLVEPTSIERVSVTEAPKTKETRTSTSSPEKDALVMDATALFEFSNATAFKNKNRIGYPCFYCLEVYKYDRLKEHQEEKHQKGSIYTLLSKYSVPNFVVYADITDLKCNICNRDIKDLYVFREHLSKIHGKKMYKIPERVIPFKLKETNLECQVCGRIFETFSLIERHMGSHFGSFECKTCGTTFLTKHRLKVHINSSHKNDKMACKYCENSFGTLKEMQTHYQRAHKTNKTIQCKKCSESCKDHFAMMQHLTDAHGAKLQICQCNECEKKFSRKESLKRHVRRCHMPENRLQCDQCSFKYFTKTELRDHYVRHDTTPQAFECDICKKIYGRKRTLMIHKKIHKYCYELGMQ